MIDDKKMQRAIELTHKNCTMVKSVAGSIKVIGTYEGNKTK